MPYMQLATSTLNAAFSAEALRGFARESLDAFDPVNGGSLSNALRQSGVDLPPGVVEFVETWPSALQKAVQAVIWENFSREATVPITFAWVPGYDFSVTIYDVHDTETSRGGITVLLTSRYPADTHPLGKSASGA